LKARYLSRQLSLVLVREAVSPGRTARNTEPVSYAQLAPQVISLTTLSSLSQNLEARVSLSKYTAKTRTYQGLTAWSYCPCLRGKHIVQMQKSTSWFQDARLLPVPDKMKLNCALVFKEC
jgi:hypothetical protein